MKKTVAIILTLAMILMVCVGCGASNVSTEQSAGESENQEPSQPVAVGTILDVPEKQLTLEKFYALLLVTDETAEGGVTQVGVTLDDTVTPGVVYLTDGLLKLSEIVYECDEQGLITKYEKGTFDESFTKDTTSTQDALAQEAMTAQTFLQMVGYGFTEAYPQYQYKKVEGGISLHYVDVDVLTYELIENGQTVGTIEVDAATGIIVKMLDANGEKLFEVMEFKTDAVEIPNYKGE